MTTRPMLKAERDRKARLRKIRRENFKVERSGHGRWTLRLVIDHQSLQIGEMGNFTREEARWMSTMAAIALHRFKYGD